MTAPDNNRRIAAEQIVAHYECELGADLMTWEARMQAVAAEVFEPGHSEAVAMEAARIADRALLTATDGEPWGHPPEFLDPAPFTAWSEGVDDALALLPGNHGDPRQREWLLRMGRIADEHKFDEAR